MTVVHINFNLTNILLSKRNEQPGLQVAKGGRILCVIDFCESQYV